LIPITDHYILFRKKTNRNLLMGIHR